MNKIIGSEESLQELKEESAEHGIIDGILICDYKVRWVHFGRWVASCEEAYFVTFYGEILF
ncbi:hypothetical protein DRN67_02025 [Candidatus Micrarchaeota archaeon]|nr:MAG: hypothetical protein DRN67_02025 [Candidatus Micrarchaeota archaeon]